MPTPIYILSLPRSGSTLLQRILAGNSQICSVAEPWFLLPLLYSLKDRGIYTEYRHDVSVQAVKDFVSHLPNGETDYRDAIQTLAINLYGKVSTNDTRYFLDKTPRYHLIADELINIFDDAKFIFLWRNPLAIAASLVESYGQGKWNVYDFNIDFYKGLPGLLSSFNSKDDRFYSLRYEDFLVNTDVELKKLVQFLDLDHHESKSMLSNMHTSLPQGLMGDSTGIHRYSNVSDEPIGKWTQSFNNPVRKSWGKRYLDWIGEERLSIMGYDKNIIINHLNEIPNGIDRIFSDIPRAIVGETVSAAKSYYAIHQEMRAFRARIS